MDLRHPDGTPHEPLDALSRFRERIREIQDLDSALSSSEERVLELADQLRTGGITLTDWELAMRVHVKNVALYSAALSSGGWAGLDAPTLARVQSSVRDQYEALRAIGQQIEAGAVAVDTRFAARMRVYAREGWAVGTLASDFEQLTAVVEEWFDRLPSELVHVEMDVGGWGSNRPLRPRRSRVEGRVH